MKTKRLKILISAYACSPYKGSEPGVGWGFVSALAPYHDLWVIVEEEKFKADIEKAIADGAIPGDSVRFFFVPKQRNRMLRKLWPPSYYRYYRRWHRNAYLLAKSLHRKVGFDLAHQLTMVGFREPGYLFKLGIPFVWGPIGGMGFFPWQFLTMVGAYGMLYYLGYNLINFLQMRFLVRPRFAAKAAGTALIVATPEIRQRVMQYWGCVSTVLIEVGLSCAPVEDIRKRAKGEPLRIIWTGLHIPRKALNMGLLALAKLPSDVRWELHILGSGPRTKSWQHLADHLGISGWCRFYGWVPRNRALEIMGRGHVMLITTLYDLTSTVTVEALAKGLPIVCLDHCGLAEVVDEKSGIKVPVTTPKRVVNGIAGAIEILAKDERRRQTLAHGALYKAAAFSWQTKIQSLDQIYQRRIESER